MTTTYTPGGTTDIDVVRLLVRDVGTNDVWVFQDEEIEQFVSLAYSNTCDAAVLAIRTRAPELARLSSWSRSIGSVSLTGGTGGADFLERQADKLEDWCRARKPISGFQWYDAEQGEPSSVFRIGQNDFPGYPGSRAPWSTVDERSGQV